ncbi:MAG TPA: hypothetical protein DD490_24425 [Acidobacteria bacterium]|nr:hypothetical protein [Acidobacteriota bacterium]
MTEPPFTPPAPVSPPSRRRGRRLVLFLLLALILLPLLAFLAGWVGLRSARVRQAILAKVAAAVEQSFGLELAVEDFAPVGWSGIDLVGVRLGAPGKAPVVTAERMRARVDLSSLRQDTAVVRSLEVFSPVFDLAAPLPELPASEGPPGFEIRRIAIHDGRVTGAPVPASAAAWVAGWRIDGIEAQGAFRNGPWALELKTAEARVERPGLPSLPLRLTGRFSQEAAGGPIRIADFAAEGGGVHLAGSGSVGFAEGGAVEVSGRAALKARDVPAEMLRPALDPQLFQDLALAGTVADVRADVVFPGSVEQLAGTAEATWKRGPRVLARMAGRILPAAEGEAPLRLAVSGDLLPASPGRRHVEGTLAAAGWAGLAAGTAEGLRAELRTPDVAAQLAQLRSLWPRLVPALPPEIPVRGGLTADLRLDGPLADPRAKVQAEWTPEAAARVVVQAEGRWSTRAGRAEATVTNLPLAALGPAVPATGTLNAHLALDGSPRGYDTLLTADATGLFVAANASDTVRLDRVQIASGGRLGLEPWTWTGTAVVDGAGLDVSGRAQAAEVHLQVEEAALSAAVASGRIRLDVPRLDLPQDGRAIDGLHLEAAGDRREVRISTLTGSFEEGRTFAASGRALLEPLLAEADLELDLVRPVEAVRAAGLSASLRGGILGVSVPHLETEAGPAHLRATIPLGALHQIPQLAAVLEGLPLERTPGPIALTLDAPDLDSASLLAALGLEARPERARGGLWTELTFDPTAPAAGRGEIRLDGLRVESPDGRATAAGPVTARLENGVLEIRPVHLVASGGGVEGAGFDLKGRAELNRSWNPFTDEPAAAVRHLAFEAGGTFDAALLHPFLQGGVASGALTLAAQASGPLDDLRGHLHATGSGASFFWASPYATRVEDPEVEISLREGRWRIEDGGMFLNGGPVQFAGGGAPGEVVTLEAAFDRVRYRLDYGLVSQLSGRLAFRLPPEGRSELSGRVTVDRALLDRDVDLDREVLAAFLQPGLTADGGESVLSGIDLNLQVATLDGVRLRNNVADLRAGWQPLTVTGTLARPVIQGRVEIDPGGLLDVYGQTVRIDRGSLVFTGDPQLDPRIDLSTTSTLQDPTIARLRGTPSPLALLEGNDPEAEPAKAELDQALSDGLVRYYGARLASQLGQAVGLSVQPVLVFGEAGDPTARLTVGADLSRHASFALSIDLRNAERRTYLLDLHGWRELPGLALQGFTTDGGGEGLSLQQVIELGGGRGHETLPRLRKLHLDVPKELPKRALRRAVRLERRGPVPEHADFDVEIDLAEALRRRGWPDPRIEVQIVPAEGKKNQVDVNVKIEPGPHASFVFSGDKIARRDRAAITSLYRPDFYEPAALAEMEAEAVRALRRRGHPSAQVKVTVATPREGERAVAIHAEAGPRGPRAAPAVPEERRRLGLVEIAGVDDVERERLRSVLALRPGEPARLDRISDAALRLIRHLQDRGFPDAVVRPAVWPEANDPGIVDVLFDVAPGAPVRVAEVRFEGERWTHRGLIEKVAALEAGGPFRDADVEAARSRLFRLGLFSRVAAAVERTADGAARITITLTERPRFRLGYGVRQVSGEDRASAVLDVTDANFLGRGMTLGLRGLYLPNDQIGRAWLRTGGLLGTDLSLETYAQARRFVDDGLVEDSREGALQLARPFGDHLTGRLYLKVLSTHLYEEEPDPFLPPFDLRIDRPYLGVQALWDTRDDPIDPAGGLFASLDLSGSGAWVGSDFDYARAFGQASTWRRLSLGGRQLVWAQSVRAGWAHAFSGQELLRAERFFAGGELSVRGYDTESLGPREELGSLVRPLGGEALFVLNQELRVALPFDLTGLVFFDAGQVWDTAGDLGTDLAKTLGLGLRARLPIGLFRLDVGFPLDRREGDESYKLYFGFGNTF